MGRTRWAPPRVPLAVAPSLALHCRPAERTAVAAEAQGEEKEVVYNYFAQDYALKSKAPPQGPDLLTQLSELLPWTAGEQEALALQEERRPSWRKSPFGPRDEADLRRRFRALVSAAGDETAALSALRRNPAVLLFGEGQLRRAGQVLVDALGRERAAEVIQKNPGALTIDPSSLKESLPSVVATAEVIDIVVRNGETARAVAGVVQLGVAVSIGKALFDVARLRLLEPASTPLA